VTHARVLTDSALVEALKQNELEIKRKEEEKQMKKIERARKKQERLREKEAKKTRASKRSGSKSRKQLKRSSDEELEVYTRVKRVKLVMTIQQ
jgi:hypothetical protein